MSASHRAQHRFHARHGGFTLVELLLSGLILVIVLVAAGAFFGQQAQLQRAVQLRNELQDRVRVVMHVVSQDLALAGNPSVTLGDGRVVSAFPGCFEDEDADGISCANVGLDADGNSVVRIRYMTSSQLDTSALAASCRDVTYAINGDELIRSDVQCGATVSEQDEVLLAPRVEAFRVLIVCADGLRYSEFPIAACEAARTAVFSFAASSLGAPRGVTNPDMTVVGSDPVPCPPGRLCFAATQEVLMPNLKEQ